MVLVDFLEVAADEVVVGANGDANALLVADVDDVLRLLGSEVLVVEVRRDVVGTVGVLAEDAKFKSLRAELDGLVNDSVEGGNAGERRGH